MNQTTTSNHPATTPTGVIRPSANAKSTLRALGESPIKTAERDHRAPPAPTRIDNALRSEGQEAFELEEEATRSTRAEELEELIANGYDPSQIQDDDNDENLNPEQRVTPEETNGLELPLDAVFDDEGPSV